MTTDRTIVIAYDKRDEVLKNKIALFIEYLYTDIHEQNKNPIAVETKTCNRASL